ncbi:hypothetical protein RHGRI_025107 [Rhododendron griersonianum]|uniref:Uncharacterized protein n=1 Tax=Rhododendron griersonianum TaxID=479676 RepID=A0AAV6JH68_9ERIC|nr:hypothetical protein RHGRI_025107 [Rhododendron griersonianum]
MYDQVHTCEEDDSADSGQERGDGSSSGEPMLLFPKRTYQPSTLRRERVHGFLVRLLTQIVDASLLMIVFGTHLSIPECGSVTVAISIPIA